MPMIELDGCPSGKKKKTQHKEMQTNPKSYCSYTDQLPKTFKLKKKKRQEMMQEDRVVMTLFCDVASC